MIQLLYLLRDICLLKRGPQDLPHSPRLLLGVCVASLAEQMGMAYVLGIQGDTFAAGIIGLTFNLGVLYLLLSLRQLGSRFVQAGTAWVMCAMLFSLLSLPIALMVGVHATPPTPDTITTAQVLLGLVSIPIVVWKVVVDAHVLRHSLNLPFMGGLLIAVLWLILEMKLSVALGGTSGAA